jgi:hypothetical protein
MTIVQTFLSSRLFGIFCAATNSIPSLKFVNCCFGFVYYGIPMSDCPSVCPSIRPFHMSHSNIRTPWPIHFKFHRVIGIDGLMVCILYGEISKYTDHKTINSNNCAKFEVNWPRGSQFTVRHTKNCLQFFVCRTVN